MKRKKNGSYSVEGNFLPRSLERKTIQTVLNVNQKNARMARARKRRINLLLRIASHRRQALILMSTKQIITRDQTPQPITQQQQALFRTITLLPKMCTTCLIQDWPKRIETTPNIWWEHKRHSAHTIRQLMPIISTHIRRTTVCLLYNTMHQMLFA